MVIQGLIFGLMDRSLNGPNSQAGRAIYMTIMVVFLNGIGTNAVILFGSILQFIVVNALILSWFVTRPGSRAKGTPDSRSARRNSRRLGKVA
jgi:5-bromo-4-chloroindolyl phosphate hydrolysis protein